MTILEKCKLNLRIAYDNNAFDEEIQDLIDACMADLNIADVVVVDQLDPLIIRAILTYVKMNFGEVDDYDRYKHSYDEQKAQMSMNSDYTDWKKGCDC